MRGEDALDFGLQSASSSYLTTRKFAADNAALVRAVNDTFHAEGQWISENTSEAEHIAQKAGKYSDEVRDQFIALKRRYRYFPVSDERFLADLQRAADWLVARKVLPEPIKVTDHLAQLKEVWPSSKLDRQEELLHKDYLNSSGS